MAALEGLSAQNVVTGKTQGSCVREPNKRKVADEAAGRVPVSFAPPVASDATTSGSSTAPLAQSTLSQSWGDAKLTAPCQALIDYFLLQFIICGAIAFAILDNGFFMDFVGTL
jgi:hypothetical protein